MRGGHRQALCLRESDERLIILFGWAELLSELLRVQIMPVLGTGRVVDFIEQSGQRLLVAQRQPDRQV